MRSWLVYSQQNNAVFCFACKLFSLKAIKLTAEGHSDWSNINSSLRSHECSSDHAQCMFKWRELDMRLQTYDKRPPGTDIAGGRKKEGGEMFSNAYLK